ncbi:MAG: putative sulfate/molybdate transporter [Marivita sp.]|uniref:putative sulfate/molybdate transporter n=1 Tax=Marivita sp. TaxID=2003365 RepID=UPI0025BB5457|nr:putative sulfate/molybdate transporter [Marivita sp.]MCI5108955.1 putative sulfate/molybdate transporter [Marivita sp.]
MLTIIVGIGAGMALGLPDAPALTAAPAPLSFPDMQDLCRAVTDLALPQLALTLTNAVFLTALVAGDLFRERAAHVTPRRLCLTSGLANLVLAPLGALPMCHGAGGVVAHHRFGARSGAAPCLIGVALLIIAALPVSVQASILSAIPAATLGALLGIAAWNLAISHRLIDARPSCRPVIAAAALATVFANPLWGLLAGTVVEILRKAIISTIKTRHH